jgi:hypothetical protein
LDEVVGESRVFSAICNIVAQYFVHQTVLPHLVCGNEVEDRVLDGDGYEIRDEEHEANPDKVKMTGFTPVRMSARVECPRHQLQIGNHV